MPEKVSSRPEIPSLFDRRQKFRSLIIVTTISVLTLVGFLLTELMTSREKAIEEAYKHAGTVATLLERQAASTIEKVDIVLKQLAQPEGLDLAHKHSAQEIAQTEKRMKVLLSAIPESQSLRVIDMQGFVVFDAAGFRSPVSISDRAYFRTHRDSPKSELVISEPIFARFTSNWVITLSRAIRDDQGHFLGLVQAAIRADYFADVYKTIASSGNVVALYDKSDRLIARFPKADNLVGRAWGGPSAAAEMIANGAAAGSFEKASRVDQVDRIYAFKSVADYPLYVIAGVDKSIALEGWQLKAWSYASASCLLIFITLFLLKNLRLDDESSRLLLHLKTDFLNKMGHEIRISLNAIIGATYLMRREAPNPRQRLHLDRVDRSAHHLLLMVDDILDLSRIESGQFRLMVEEFHLEDLLNELRQVIQQKISTKGLRLNVEAPDLPHALRGDRRRLAQALSNYLTNAVRMSEHGTITLRVKVEMEQDPRIKLRFEVEDQGLGLRPEQMEGLFDAFDKVDASFSDKMGGAGIGLALTQRLAQMMGGEAGVLSQYGLGSTFWLSAMLDKAGKPIEVHAQLQLGYAGRRVLVVEDEPTNQEIACEVLRDAGLFVDGVDSAARAIDKLETEQFDLILMDCDLPDMTGMDATRRIRNMATRRFVPILAMTASTSAEGRGDCLDAGMNDFISKPFQPDALMHVVLKWLKEVDAPESPI